MPESLLISPKPPAAPALNHAELRRLGLAYLERVVGNLWTDYNTHDPGITLLELLCYGITDIAYRTTFPDADLFAPAPGETVPGPAEPPFVTARFALTNAPVIQADYRKLFLDRFPELRNVWLDPVTQPLFADPRARKLTRTAGPETVPVAIRGLYRLRVLFHDPVKPPRRQEVLAELLRFYHQHRNLSEDLAAVEVTPVEDIIVCAEIQLAPTAEIEETHARVLQKLREFLSPIIPRHSLGALVERGLSPETIFDGPRLEHGFILDQDLAAAGAHTSIRSSDLIAVILAVPGVRAVTRFQLNRPPKGGQSFEPVDWELPLAAGHHPRLTLPNARLEFYKGPLPFRSNAERVRARLEELETEAAAGAMADGPFDRAIPAGEWRDLGDFTTLQESLPLCYGVGRRGLDSTATAQRQAEARQLQAFLLIFDQVLANYLAQLTRVRELFSNDVELRRSYFSRAVADLPDLRRVLAAVAGNEQATAAEVAQTYLELIESSVKAHDPWIRRRSQILDHLLARFGEAFTDQVIAHDSAAGAGSPLETLEAKRVFFADLPALAGARLQAHDLLDPAAVWDTANVSGFEKRLGRLLGFPSVHRRNLSTIVYELYEELDVDPASEIRFRIIDIRNRRIILSGTRHFHSKAEAVAEMRLAIRLAMQAAHYRFKTADDGRHYFVIVHVTAAGEDIVAMRKQFWATRAEAEAERDRVVERIAGQYSEEGMFLVEHVLMRPRPEAPANWPLLPPPCACSEGPAGAAACAASPANWDPYSFRVHLVFPGYTARLSQPGFRQYIEEVIRRELPAHLIARICFVDREQLGRVEKRYRAWLESLAAGKPDAAALTRLLETLNELHTIHPAGVLHDCRDDADEVSAVVLNQSRLGTLPPEAPSNEPDDD